MAIHLRNESDRLPAAIEFTKKKIDELNMKINECDYTEDINGKPVYCRGAYPNEKYTFECEKRNWEIMFDILTSQAPHSIIN